MAVSAALTLAWLLAGPASASAPYSITGTVRHPTTRAPIPDALVVLQCTCLQGTRETQTNRDGRYMFRTLPAGTYTVQVLVGQTDASRLVTLGPPAP